MNTRILIAVVVSLFVCQQAHSQQPGLEGTWDVMSQARDGIQHDFDRFGQWRIVDNEMSYRWTIGGSWSLANPFIMNPSAMPPEFEFESYLGIYEIEDNLLTVCFGASEEARPDRFESTEDYPTILWVLRRVEEDE